MKNNWQQDIHDRLGNYEIDAPKELWESIQHEMADIDGASIQNGNSSITKKRRHIAYAAAVASVALLLGYSIYSKYANSDPSGIAKWQIDSMPAKSLGISALAINHSKHFIADNSPMMVYLSRDNELSTGSEASSQSMDSLDSLETISVDIKKSDAENCKETNTVGNQDNPVKYEDRNMKDNGIHHEESYTNLIAYNADIKHHAYSSKASRWSVSTSAMGAMGTSKTTTSIGTPITVTGPGDTNWEDNPMLDINIFNQGKEVKTQYNHRLPVRIGVKVAYALSERWSIESGLTYTRLSSDVKYGTKENYFTGEQKLNYMGIPVNVKYNAWSYKRLHLYGSVGILAEKCVSGTFKKEYILKNSRKQTETLSIDTKPLQISVNTSLGVQFDFLDNFSIYAEPGISYFCDDHSSLQTIYKEKPLNININTGVRYTIRK